MVEEQGITHLFCPEGLRGHTEGSVQWLRAVCETGQPTDHLAASMLVPETVFNQAPTHKEYVILIPGGCRGVRWPSLASKESEGPQSRKASTAASSRLSVSTSSPDSSWQIASNKTVPTAHGVGCGGDCRRLMSSLCWFNI